MENLNVRFLLLALVGALVLAGCASNNNANNNGGTAGGASGSTSTPPPAMSVADAQALFQSASSSPPQQFGIDMTFTNLNGTKVMTAHGSLDNTSKTGYFEMTFDPSVFQQEAGMMGDASAFSKGIAMYTTNGASAFIVNGTAVVNVENASEPSSSGMGSMTQNPFGNFFGNPEAAVLKDSHVNITNVEGVVWHGKPAMRLTIQDTQDGQPVTGHAVVYTGDKRLAHIDANTPKAKSSSGGPSGFGNVMDQGGNVSIDFLYGSEVTVVAPESATRAVGLAYKSDHSAFSFGGSAPSKITWTFQMDGGIPLSDVQAVVAKPHEQSGMGVPSTTGIDEDWHVGLAEGSKTVDEVTVAFNDNDHDGKVSKGDTLVISTTKTDSNGDPAPLPTVVLKDTKTGLYVTPGFEVFALVGGAALVALVLRRR